MDLDHFQGKGTLVDNIPARLAIYARRSRRHLCCTVETLGCFATPSGRTLAHGAHVLNPEGYVRHRSREKLSVKRTRDTLVLRNVVDGGSMAQTQKEGLRATRQVRSISGQLTLLPSAAAGITWLSMKRSRANRGASIALKAHTRDIGQQGTQVNVVSWAQRPCQTYTQLSDHVSHLLPQENTPKSNQVACF